MNDDIVVQKILKLLENNTAFIGYALNGGIGTKINVRNTETGKTIQALSINVDSSGEVLVVKDSDDGKYKAVTFKAAEQVTERIIQIRKTKPIDDKKLIEYTDSDIEVFYLFVKLIDTGNPYPTQLQSTWIRKGSSCTQFVGAYERCNYAAKETIGGTSYTGLPYKTYPTLNDCLNDDLGRDAKTPHGSGDEQGLGLGYKIYTTLMTSVNEQNLRDALTSHDEYYQTNFRELFGYGTILDCTGSMYVQGWEFAYDPVKNKYFLQCDFSYLPGYTTECTLEMQQLGYCDSRGFINSKTPPPGTPGVGSIDNSWAYTYGWVNLPYSFMYLRHFPYNYLNGSDAKGSFLVLEVNDDQIPQIPPGYLPWVPGCPVNGQGGPYNGTGGNRFPDGVPPIKKRDMKLSTHKAEIWLGSSKKTEAIKLYELGASDLFSGMYNPFIVKADETKVDIEKRLNRGLGNTEEEQLQHEKFYENWNKNRIDLIIDPRVWIYILNNVPRANYQSYEGTSYNIIPGTSLQNAVTHLYKRTLNLTIIDKNNIVVHLKYGLKPANTLSNTDCKGAANGFGTALPKNTFYAGQSWEYQKSVTIKVKNWKDISIANTLDLAEIEGTWDKDYISRKFLTSFGTRNLDGNGNQLGQRDLKFSPTRLTLRPDSNVDINKLIEGNNYEQWNYAVAKRLPTNKQLYSFYNPYFYLDYLQVTPALTYSDKERKIGLGTYSWWEMWNKSYYSKKDKRISSIVGYEKNFHQIVTSTKLNPSLNYVGDNSTYSFTNAVSALDYFEYLTWLPKVYLPSTIKLARENRLPTSSYGVLKKRDSILNDLGLNFFISYWESHWTWDATFAFGVEGPEYQYITIDNPFYYNYPQRSFTTTNLLYSAVTQSQSYPYGIHRFDTLQWFVNLWAQFVFDGFIKLDVDSYKEVDFNLHQPLNKYVKYTNYFTTANSEYSFSEVPEDTVNVDTVLSPGKLEIANKQVKMTKPTNVDLDPNMSFLLYLYPFVQVTKKKKEI